ncbi:MAG: methyltransferase domain-containing protein [Tepidiformaceae bacterium]
MSSNRKESQYTHGHHPAVIKVHALRTAEKDAHHLLKRLQPGMRLLDVGCGPGTITEGLARAVAPGLTIGIDPVTEILNEARQQDRTNSSPIYMPANTYQLPFNNNVFDVVHLHQVLQHLDAPITALKEIKRVLKPGGIVSLRESDYGSMVAWPRLPLMERWLDLYHAVVKQNGADADAGRRIPAWLRASGFHNAELTGDSKLYTGTNAQFWGETWSERTLKSSFGQQAIQYNLSTPEEIKNIGASWKEWSENEDACFAFVQVQAIATKE